MTLDDQPFDFVTQTIRVPVPSSSGPSISKKVQSKSPTSAFAPKQVANVPRPISTDPRGFARNKLSGLKIHKKPPSLFINTNITHPDAPRPTAVKKPAVDSPAQQTPQSTRQEISTSMPTVESPVSIASPYVSVASSCQVTDYYRFQEGWKIHPRYRL